MARGLADAGIEPGERVVLHLENEHLDRWLIAYAAIHKAGAVAVPTNTRLTARELVDDPCPRRAGRVITSHASAPDAGRGGGRRPRLDRRLVIHADDHQSWCPTLVTDDSPFQVPVGDGDLADILYTSGTTGLPKGVAVRHRNTHLIPNGEPPWTGNSWIHCSPLSTFAGISFVYNPMKMGMRGLYLPRFDADPWFDAVEQWRPTMAFLVPGHGAAAPRARPVRHADLSSLTLLSIGSAPLAPTLHRRVAERLPDAMVTNNYSMTEAGTAFTYLPPGEVTRRPGSVGMPLPPTEIRIADERGERGAGRRDRRGAHRGGRAPPRVLPRSRGHRDARGRGEWLRSGDLGYLDERRLPLHRGPGQGHRHPRRQQHRRHRGRSGPLRARRACSRRPWSASRTTCWARTSAPSWSPDPVTTSTPTSSARFCAERLADYKVPRHVWFVDELPRNATGKVLKRDLTPPD